jgi:hypothetical protein
MNRIVVKYHSFFKQLIINLHSQSDHLIKIMDPFTHIRLYVIRI